MTTKIQFKLSNDILLTVIQMVEKTDDYVVQSIKDALLVSIKEDLIAKLEDKAKNIQKQISILDHNKKHAIVLKYHEAYTMYKLLELVYEKETFADHPHIKKIKRLLIDLENKVESFTTENKTSDQTETALPDRPSFPSLGVNEIIIEEATILEGDATEELQTTMHDDDNPVLDPSIDVNEIIVKNYSIFDLLEEDHTEETASEETQNNDIEVSATVVSFDEVENLQKELAEEKKQQQEILPTPIEEQQEVVEQVLTPLHVETQTTEVKEADIVEEGSTVKQGETTIPSWAQQTTPPVFDGIVTKTSICIESDETEKTVCITAENEEEPLNLFEEAILPLPIQPLEEKSEKEVKKEKRKPAKDNSQQGQISLF